MRYGKFPYCRGCKMTGYEASDLRPPFAKQYDQNRTETLGSKGAPLKVEGLVPQSKRARPFQFRSRSLDLGFALAVLAFCTASFACPYLSHHDRGLEGEALLSEATSQPCDIALRSQIGCLYLTSLEIPKHAVLEWCSGDGKPRAFVLACILLIIVTAVSHRDCSSCSECTLCFDT